MSKTFNDMADEIRNKQAQKNEFVIDCYAPRCFRLFKKSEREALCEGITMRERCSKEWQKKANAIAIATFPRLRDAREYVESIGGTSKYLG